MVHTPQHKAAGIQSGKARRANRARVRAVAAQRDADDAQTRADKLADIADQRARDGWPDSDDDARCAWLESGAKP